MNLTEMTIKGDYFGENGMKNSQNHSILYKNS